LSASTTLAGRGFPAPSSPLVDLSTGQVTPQWLAFLRQQYIATGGGTGSATNLAQLTTNVGLLTTSVAQNTGSLAAANAAVAAIPAELQQATLLALVLSDVSGI